MGIKGVGNEKQPLLCLWIPYIRKRVVSRVQWSRCEDDELLWRQ